MAEQEVGFVTMGKASGAANARTIGVGMLGYAFMGKAHANAYRTIPYMTWPPPLVPRLVAVAGRTEEAVAEIRAGSGTQFDPLCVEAFEALAAEDDGFVLHDKRLTPTFAAR